MMFIDYGQKLINQKLKNKNANDVNYMYTPYGKFRKLYKKENVTI